MCNCKCECCNPQRVQARYSGTSVRLAKELRDKAVRNLKKTAEGRRILEQRREEGKIDE